VTGHTLIVDGGLTALAIYLYTPYLWVWAFGVIAATFLAMGYLYFVIRHVDRDEAN
jgi:hypothetical protein